MLRDITGRKRAEEALRESEERLRTIIHTSMDGFWMADMQGRLLEVNESYCRMSGYSAEELLGMRISDLEAGEASSETANDVQRLMAQGGHRFETQHRRKDGSILDVEISAQYQPSAGGRIVAFLRDITERKRAEGTLAVSEERFRALAESSLVGIYVMQDGKYAYVNPAMAGIFGYSVAEMTGMTPDVIVHPSHHTMVRENIRRRIGGEVRSMHYQVRGRYRDGSVRDVEVYGSTVQLNGRPALVGTLVDITERKRAEEERNSLQLQLAQAQKMESVGRLAGGIAHDFNNLMSVILLHGESALEELSSEDSARGEVTALLEAARKAVALIRQLMAFSHVHAVETEILDLNSVIAECEKLLRRLIGEDINLVVTPGSGLSTVRADPGQIGQIIINLAVNARDAMPHGGTLTIETANAELDESYARSNPGARQGSYIMLAVRDTGVGMDAETQARAFDPFFTTKEVGKGTGLGLSIVYGIVQENGGYITLHSEPGHGTEFRIFLPRVLETPQPVPAAEAAPEERGVEAILLAEDEPALREKVRNILEGAGYRVFAGEDVDEVIQIAMQHKGRLDLLLTDVVMPVLSGPELARRLQPLHQHMKVLYMSGYPDPHKLDATLASTAGFIQKPFTKQKLLRRLREVLDGH